MKVSDFINVLTGADIVRVIKNGTCIEKGYKYDFVGLRVLNEIIETIYIDTVKNQFVVIVRG